MSLSEAIGKASPYEPRFLTRALAKLLVSDERFVTSGRLHSDGKMELFYKSIMLVMFITTLILAATGGIQFGALRESPAVDGKGEAQGQTSSTSVAPK